MNYTEITQTALQYADRTDVETIENMDNFLRIVEARINRELKTGDNSLRSIIATIDEKEYYTLPSDFNGLRDVQIQDLDGGSPQTLDYVSPTQMNEYKHNETAQSNIVYTIIGKQLQIYPNQKENTIEIVYYTSLIPLSTINLENWISIDYPDAYIFGLLVEINAFTKDATATQIWDGRFKETLNSIEQSDQENRWSGTPLAIKTIGF